MKSRFLVSLFALGVGLGGASASAKDVPFAKVRTGRSAGRARLRHLDA